MKQRKLSMRKIKEILRLHNDDLKLSNREIARILQISKTTVKRCLEHVFKFRFHLFLIYFVSSQKTLVNNLIIYH